MVVPANDIKQYLLSDEEIEMDDDDDDDDENVVRQNI